MKNLKYPVRIKLDKEKTKEKKIWLFGVPVVTSSKWLTVTSELQLRQYSPVLSILLIEESEPLAKPIARYPYYPEQEEIKEEVEEIIPEQSEPISTSTMSLDESNEELKNLGLDLNSDLDKPSINYDVPFGEIKNLLSLDELKEFAEKKGIEKSLYSRLRSPEKIIKVIESFITQLANEVSSDQLNEDELENEAELAREEN